MDGFFDGLDWANSIGKQWWIRICPGTLGAPQPPKSRANKHSMSWKRWTSQIDPRDLPAMVDALRIRLLSTDRRMAKSRARRQRFLLESGSIGRLDVGFPSTRLVGCSSLGVHEIRWNSPSIRIGSGFHVFCDERRQKTEVTKNPPSDRDRGFNHLSIQLTSRA